MEAFMRSHPSMSEPTEFADSSQALVDNILKHLRPGGHALVDFTIGAHYDDQKCIKTFCDLNDINKCRPSMAHMQAQWVTLLESVAGFRANKQFKEMI